MSWTEIDSARNFVQAGISMGKVHMDRAIETGVDQTGHSCYEEGWAAGYLAAFNLVANFIAEKPAEEAKPQSLNEKYDEGFKYAREAGRSPLWEVFGSWYARSDWDDVVAAYADFRKSETK